MEAGAKLINYNPSYLSGNMGPRKGNKGWVQFVIFTSPWYECKLRSTESALLYRIWLPTRAFQFAIRIDSLCESTRLVKKIGLSIH